MGRDESDGGDGMTPEQAASVLQSTGPLGLALIVMVVLLFMAVGLITRLIIFILKDERIPKDVWVEECQSHATEMSAIGELTVAVRQVVWVLERVAPKSGGGLGG
jgi:hypothetical protein